MAHNLPSPFHFTGRVAAVVVALSLLATSAQTIRAGSATWKYSPDTTDWNTASNWTPATVPNGAADTATFDTSALSDIDLSADTEVDGIIFDSSASQYTITIGPALALTLSGQGIINDSLYTQTFVIVAGQYGSNGGVLQFLNTSAAGDGSFALNGAGDDQASGGSVLFFDSSSADHGAFTINGAELGGGDGDLEFFNGSTAADGVFTTNGGVRDGGFGGLIAFHDAATAAFGIFNNNGGTVGGSSGGNVVFIDTSTAANGTFTNNAGAVDGAHGGMTEFVNDSNAATATLTASGAAVSGAFGGVIKFSDSSTAGNAILIAEGGSNGGSGGSIQFSYNQTDGGTARAEVFGNGNLDFSAPAPWDVTIGSIEGDGNIFLGPATLSVGSNNLDTVFSGVIQSAAPSGGGGLIKIGTGTLTLSGANIYTGGTQISRGTLLVNNTSGSGTGSGPVLVWDGATLGGTGTIQLSGNAILASNGTIAPGGSPGQLTIDGGTQLSYASNLSFEIGGTAPATQYDVLSKIDSAGLTLSGSLSLAVINAFTPQASDTFTIVSTQTSLAGSFTNVKSGGRLNTTNGVGSFQVDYSGNTVVLSSFGAPLPSSRSQNISTRGQVQTGDDVMIGGFIIAGSVNKKIIVRGIGPSLSNSGVANALADPTIELYGPGGFITSNDNWKSDQQTEIANSGLAPDNDLESAIVRTLPPGGYTVILRGKNDSTGVGLVEAYDLEPGTDSRLANISTRALVGTGSDVMIGGIIVGPDNANASTYLIRVLGPSLQPAGISNFLADPVLELRDANGTLAAFNDNWKDVQQDTLGMSGLAPANDAEPAIQVTLAAGGWTAIVSGANDTTGVALVEAYYLP